MLGHDAYNDRLNRVLDYVHAHLEDDLSFDRMAEVACLSPYHWSRIYSAMRGETVVATIRRLRLQRAAERLSNTDLDLATVALRAGYGSADAFGRAFKEAFGLSPAIYRAQGSHAAFKAACVTGDAQAFPVEIVNLPEQRCAGMDHIGFYMGIDHAMGRLFGELAARGALPAEPAMKGVFFDDPDLASEDRLRSRACLPVVDTVALDGPLVETVLRGLYRPLCRHARGLSLADGSLAAFVGLSA